MGGKGQELRKTTRRPGLGVALVGQEVNLSLWALTSVSVKQVRSVGAEPCGFSVALQHEGARASGTEISTPLAL